MLGSPIIFLKSSGANLNAVVSVFTSTFSTALFTPFTSVSSLFMLAKISPLSTTSLVVPLAPDVLADNSRSCASVNVTQFVISPISSMQLKYTHVPSVLHVHPQNLHTSSSTCNLVYFGTTSPLTTCVKFRQSTIVSSHVLASAPPWKLKCVYCTKASWS